MSTAVWGLQGCPTSSQVLLDANGPSTVRLHQRLEDEAKLRRSSPQVLCLTINDDGSCVGVGTWDGFMLFTAAMDFGACSTDGSESVTEVCRRRVRGGVRMLALHHHSSLILFSGASPATCRTVTLWNDAAAPSQVDEGDDPDADDNDSQHESADEDTDGPLENAEESACIVARLEVPGVAIAALKFHPRLVLVAEPFRVHVFNGELQHIRTLNSPQRAESAFRSIPSAVRGDPGKVWDYSPNLVAISSLAETEVVHGRKCATLRCIMLGETIGSVTCAHFHDASPAVTSPIEIDGRSAVQRGMNFEEEEEKVESRSPSASSSTSASSFVTKDVQPPPHSHRVQCLTISASGRYALSCSEQGTVLKLIDVLQAKVRCQFNRGVQRALISSLSISGDECFGLCVSSNATVHVFWLGSQTRRDGHAVDNETLTTAVGISYARGGVMRSTSSALAHILAPSVTAVGSTMWTGLHSYAKSEYAFAKFSMSMVNTADSDAAFLGGSLQSSEGWKESRSDQSRAFLMANEDCIKEQMDISEHSGFDPLFSAAQFRAFSAPPPSAPTSPQAIYILLACGSVVRRIFGMKSKLVHVGIQLPVASQSAVSPAPPPPPSLLPLPHANGSRHQTQPAQHPQDVTPPVATTAASAFIVGTALIPKDFL